MKDDSFIAKRPPFSLKVSEVAENEEVKSSQGNRCFCKETVLMFGFGIPF